ncbi:MAG: DUF1992 domain-containing protein [Anaerolineae bacterium]|nr:DUF1992 domain-containing protein [Anaerolineae bacterium]
MPDIADEHIRKAMERGDFENLNSAGKRLPLDLSRLVPEEDRLANKIMADNEVLPPWIAERQDLEQALDRARQGWQRACRRWKQAQERLQRMRYDEHRVRQQWAAEDDLKAAESAFQDQIRAINRQILNYNLKVPTANLTLDALDAVREMGKLR